MAYSEHPQPASETLPTMYDLLSEDPEEPGLPDVGASPSRDVFHDFQPQLLRETCQSPAYPAQEMFAGTDLNLYYDVRHPRWHKRPDWFLVLGVPRALQQTDLRWSYVIWQEGVSPFLAIELLSPGTEAEDLGQTLREVNQPPTKWQVYEQLLRIPYYGVFDRYTRVFRLFRLLGSRYQPVELSEQRFWFEELKLGLGVWQGQYQSTEGSWLRWYDAEDSWVATAEEIASQERQRADEAQRRADEAQQRAERLVAQLRALGVDPED
ncbi:Uma2 family endonuclease [Leptolyngbya sp. PCC 6406]|uniref:Uma2 family endonuclease n=1 Tax=Leptolyngbya sp. PCC 6406 TaxID=1173264 RepID=UPI0002ABF169|nr:Uma2 family endonuclease [Leptolyngbya sp. PCC 6406]